MELIKELHINPLGPCCKDSYAQLQGDTLQICINTLSSYSDWLKERRYRITGTKAYELFTYASNKNPD